MPNYQQRLQEVVSKFLNVDLDIKSRSSLASVLQHLGDTVMTLHSGRIGRNHWIVLEIAWPQPKTPTEGIVRLARLLDTLPARQKALLAKASITFDIGVQGGWEPASAEWVIDRKAVQAAARLGAQIKVTVYSPRLALEAEGGG